MYQYEYEEIKINRKGYKTFHGITYATDEFHEIIHIPTFV